MTSKPIPNYTDSLLRTISLSDGGTGGSGGCDCDMTSYLLKDDASKTYQPKGNYLTQHQSLAEYQKTIDADSKYQPKGNYLTQHQSLADYLKTADADKKYQPIGSGGDAPDLTSYLKTADADNKYQPKGNYLTEHQSLSSCVKYNDLKVPIESVIADEILKYLKENIDSRITGEHNTFYDVLVTGIKEGYRVNPEITAPNEISIELQLPNHNAETMNGSGFVIEVEELGNNHKKTLIALFFVTGIRYTTFPYEFMDYLFNPDEPNWRYDNQGKYIVDIDETKYRVTNPNIVNWVFANREYHEKQNNTNNSINAIQYIENTLNKGNAGGFCPLNNVGLIPDEFINQQKYRNLVIAGMTQSTINGELRRCLDEDGVVIDDTYKEMIIHAQKNYKPFPADDISLNVWSEYGFEIKSFWYPLAGGSVIMYYYYNESNEVKRAYFIIDGYGNVYPYGNEDDGPVISSVRHKGNHYYYEFDVSNTCSSEGRRFNEKLETDSCFNNSLLWCYYKSFDDCYPLYSIVMIEDGLDINTAYPINGTWEKMFSQTIEGKTINYYKRTA